MCGIVCGINTNNELIDQALISLSSRGPDSQDYIKIDNVFLGHTLLSISSPDPVSQPIWSNDKTIVGCINGEIYNYTVLRNLLESCGYVFKTTSDSEVIIHGIHWIGKDFVKYLNGEFCFVIYDTRSKSWICAVDSFGTKPLRYFLDKRQFLISSTVKTLSKFKNIEIDITSCLFSLSSQCLPNGKTLFSEIHTIPPSAILIIDSNLNPTLESYTIKTKRLIEDINGIESLLESSILKRVPKYHKLSIVLSSGIDSSSIAYYLKKNNVEFNSFSIDFPESEYSESEDIKRFCKSHNISTTFIDITNQDLISYFPIVTLNSENLSMNPHAVGKYLVNREMINQGYRVCMTGDGADELFYGYPHFHTNNDFQFLTNSKNTAFNYYEILSENGKDLIDFDCILNESMGTDQELYYRYWLSEYGLKLLGDSQSASLGQEHRYPFLDNTLYNYVQSIENFKSLNNPSKQILRNIVKSWNPTLSTIPKRPFASPPMNKEWLSLFQKYVFENNKFFELNIFDRNLLIPYVQRLASESLPNRIILSQILSLGIVLEELCNG